MSKKGRKRERDDAGGDADGKGPTKRKRQLPDDKLQLYKHYEDLAAESDEVRLNAAKQLILKLSPQSQPAAEDVQKALNRLIKGLCTQRKAARFGFCITLTELLQQLIGKSESSIEGLDLDVGSLLKRVERQTKIEGNASGGERRDHLIGKLFAYKAIMQSSILVKPELSLESWNELLDRIYGMARDVPWLREECGLVLVEAIRTLESKPEYEPGAKELARRLTSFNLVNSPEGVAIWLAMRTKFEAVLPANTWHQNDPLSKKERTRLAKILKENFHASPVQGEPDPVKSAAANPNPSFAWDVILSKLLYSDSGAKEDRKEVSKSEFSQFWADTVDASLFGSSSSHERKAQGFKLFSKMVCQVPDWAIPSLFSPNLMRTLLNQTKKDERFLHAAALNAWKAVTQRAQQSPESALSLVVGITSKNGSADFDTFTKVKTLEQVLLSTDDDSLRNIVQHLHSLINRPETSEQSVADHRRQTIADLLLNVVKHYKHYESTSAALLEKDNWLSNILELLVEYAFFVPSQNTKTRKIPLPVISEPNRKMFQERLSSCITRLLNVDIGDQTYSGLFVLHSIRSKATKSKNLEPVFKADDSVMRTIENAIKTLDSIATKESTSGNSSIGQGFQLLYTFTLLQIYNGDTDAVMMLEDLDAARTGLLEAAKGSASQRQNIFIEVLVSFLGHPRTLYHRIAMEAFTRFASEVSLEGLQSLADILDTEESLEGQKQLFAPKDELEEGASLDDEDDIGQGSDVEMLDGDESEVDLVEEDTSDDADTDTDDDEEDEDEDEELTQFNNMLAMTLQTSKPSTNGDASAETSDESDMDDEQMMALDPHLSKIFKQRSQITGKKQREEAKKNMVQFKARVLDLVAIFLDKQYSNPLSLQVLLPLLRLTRASANKQLVDKSTKLLKAAFETNTKHKTPLPKPEDVGATWEVLEGIHEEAQLGGGANVHANTCSTASLHVVKVLVALDRSNYAKITDLYAESQKKWFVDCKSALQPVFFSQFLNWSTQSRSGSTQKYRA